MSKTFIDQVLAGEVLDPEHAIDDAVARWHDDESESRSLHDALGMTWEEYSLWAEDPSTLPIILYSHRFNIRGLPLLAAANGPDQGDLAIAARSAQELTQSQHEALRAWLGRHGLA
jgi:hypothetical protein